jgi:hypothetical protein
MTEPGASDAVAPNAPSESFGLAFLDYLKTLPWCKQENGSLVAVHKLTSEVIEAVREHEIKVYPGGMNVKLPRSVLMGLQKQCDDEQPLPAVLVYKHDVVEIWFRRAKSEGFPFDTWSDPSALAIEREKCSVPGSSLGANFSAVYNELIGKANVCPAMMPPY